MCIFTLDVSMVYNSNMTASQQYLDTYWSKHSTQPQFYLTKSYPPPHKAPQIQGVLCNMLNLERIHPITSSTWILT